MKTAIIFDEVQADLQFYVVDGDWTKFDGVYINNCQDEELSDEFYSKFYDEETNLVKHEKVSKEKFKQVIKDGANLICCGFMP